LPHRLSYLPLGTAAAVFDHEATGSCDACKEPYIAFGKYRIYFVSLVRDEAVISPPTNRTDCTEHQPHDHYPAASRWALRSKLPHPTRKIFSVMPHKAAMTPLPEARRHCNLNAITTGSPCIPGCAGSLRVCHVQGDK